MYTLEQQAFINARVEQAKREIATDICSGRVDPNVKDFGELHDYVDANEYGGLCDDATTQAGNALFPERTDEDTLSSQGYMDAANVIQNTLNAWLVKNHAAIVEADEIACNAGCAAIQSALGITEGDFAGVYFSGDESAAMREIFARYFYAELRHAYPADEERPCAATRAPVRALDDYLHHTFGHGLDAEQFDCIEAPTRAREALAMIDDMQARMSVPSSVADAMRVDIYSRACTL